MKCSRVYLIAQVSLSYFRKDKKINNDGDIAILLG